MAVTIERPSIIPKIEENSRIGLHLRKVRIERGLSQPEVAKLIGTTSTSITDWELGHHPPQIHFVPQIVAFIGYNPYPKQETKTLGGKIKMRRLLNGLSHRNMAKLLQVDPSTIKEWELNDNAPSEPRLNRLLALLKQNMAATNASSEADLGSAGAQLTSKYANIDNRCNT